MLRFADPIQRRLVALGLGSVILGGTYLRASGNSGRVESSSDTRRPAVANGGGVGTWQIASARALLGGALGTSFLQLQVYKSQEKPHSVYLSWSPSSAISAGVEDAILGYNVYRRTAYDSWLKLNADPITDTSFVDYRVTVGRLYFYATRTVSLKGVESKNSNVIRILIPLQ